MRITTSIIGGLLCLAAAASADATVTYSFSSMWGTEIRSFTYTAPDFVTSGTVDASDLDTCMAKLTPSAHCVSVSFDTSDETDTIWFGTAADRIASRVASSAAGASGVPFVFASGTFDRVGSFWSLEEDAMLTVQQSSAAPEPASWMMMIGGFGLVGAAARRRRIALQPA